jgi:glycosyltransferase 2 family protein
MAFKRPAIQWITIIMVAVFIIAGVLIIALDWGNMRQVIGKANWPVISFALLFTAVSYVSLSAGLTVVFRTFGIQLGIRYLMAVGFVSNVVTYLFNVGGVTGLSLQFIIVKKRGLATEDILAASLFQLVFSSLMLIAILPVGFFNLLGNHPGSRGGDLAIAIAAGVLTLLLIAAGVIVFAAAVRSAVMRFASRIVRTVIHREIGKQVTDFDTAMSRGLALMRRRPAAFIALIILVILDWAGTITALWFCFRALGTTVNVGTLITGFSLGITAGFISLIPGGLGVQEGSMAGIYALLGIPLSTAILAAILFRIVYYFIPFLVSLGFYRRLLRGAD